MAVPILLRTAAQCRCWIISPPVSSGSIIKLSHSHRRNDPATMLSNRAWQDGCGQWMQQAGEGKS